MINELRVLKQNLTRAYRLHWGRHQLLRELKPLSNGFFINLPTYCISLKNDPRRDFMKAQVSRPGLKKFDFFEAVDGRKCSIDDFEASGDFSSRLSSKYSSEVLSPSMIALSLTHHNLYKHLLEHQIDFALILEDDTVFTNELNKLDLQSLQPFDLLMLDSWLRYQPPASEQIFNRIYNPNSFLAGTAAYLISASGAQKMKEISFPVVHTADHLIKNANYHITHKTEVANGIVDHLQWFLANPRPIINGSLAGYWGSALSGSKAISYLQERPRADL